MIRIVSSLRSHHELFVNLLLRELRVRYRRSILGWLWSMLNPIALTLVYSFVFTRFLKVTPAPGQPSQMTSFAFFLLAGLLPWNLFTGGLNVAMSSLLGSAGLIQKVSFPRELVVMGPVAALGVSLAVELGVLMVAETFSGYNVLKFTPILVFVSAMLLAFTIGVGLALASINIRYRDVQHLTTIALLVFFYLTPILYSPERIPERSEVLGLSIPVRSILLLNPLSRFVQAYRNCLYDVRFPPLDTLLGLSMISLVTFTGGLHIFTRRSRHFPDEF